MVVEAYRHTTRNTLESFNVRCSQLESKCVFHELYIGGIARECRLWAALDPPLSTDAGHDEVSGQPASQIG